MPTRALLLALTMTTLVPAAEETRLIIVDPGHFHAALIQKDMYPFLSPKVSVYAQLSPELADYMNRVALFNARGDNPTRWELEVHTGPGFFERMLRERAGNAVVFTGRNRGKIDRIAASLDAGYHVFADKPWIITSVDLPKLAAALDLAGAKRLAAYDIMTERFEITSILQRELVNTPAVFGEPKRVRARSVHHIMKMVAGVPIKRPAWFFDIDEYGEPLADVGTHVVDLIQWTLFPKRELDYRNDVHITGARHWATPLSPAQYQQVTGEAPKGRLDYLGNNSVSYTAGGIPCDLEILWNWEAKPGAGDIYEASFEGTKSRIELRQGEAEHYAPELYVAGDTGAALPAKVTELAKKWPGLTVDQHGSESRIVIPAKYRVGHETHFAQVANQFFAYMKAPETQTAWEKANMLVKYYITTKGVEAAK